MSLIPVLGKVRQEVHHESEGSLDYAVSSKLLGLQGEILSWRTKQEVGEMTQHKGNGCSPRGPRISFSTHTVYLSYRGSQTLFWPPQEPGMQCSELKYMRQNTHTHKRKLKKLLKPETKTKIRADNLSLVARTHRLEGENSLAGCPLTSWSVSWHTHSHICMHMHTH